ncbi:MAB_1171c family putative transporter [Glycomyces arizonensis]|uniref:MAB_1171c family putative transporter n=1 Tax=Glycomyces arizonensis TaxID=256035 RepID=UPI0005587B50
MKEILFGFCVAVAILTVFPHLSVLQRSKKDPTRWTIVTALSLMAAALATAMPGVAGRINTALPNPNSASLLVAICNVAFSIVAQMLIVQWTRPPERARTAIRFRLLAIAIAVTTLVVLFAAAAVTRPTPHLLLEESHHPRVAAFIFFYLASIALGYGALAYTCFRQARGLDSPWLRASVRLIACGACLGLVYCVSRAVTVVLWWTERAVVPMASLVPLMLTAGALLAIVGFNLPVWHPVLSRLRMHLSMWRAYHQLSPLWWRLLEVAPHMSYWPPRSRFSDRFTVRNIGHRLCQRVIEILDINLAIRTRVTPDLSGAARSVLERTGLNGESLRLALIAAEIEIALRLADLHGIDPPGPHSSAATGMPDGNNDDVLTEALSLVTIARAHRRSPYIRECAEEALSATAAETTAQLRIDA